MVSVTIYVHVAVSVVYCYIAIAITVVVSGNITVVVGVVGDVVADGVVVDIAGAVFVYVYRSVWLRGCCRCCC